jgi:hypothetical protein
MVSSFEDIGYIMVMLVYLWNPGKIETFFNLSDTVRRIGVIAGKKLIR